jgi:hypothetical protein
MAIAAGATASPLLWQHIENHDSCASCVYVIDLYDYQVPDVQFERGVFQLSLIEIMEPPMIEFMGPLHHSVTAAYL